MCSHCVAFLVDVNNTLALSTPNASIVYESVFLVTPTNALFISSASNLPSSKKALARRCSTVATELKPASRAAVAGLIEGSIMLAPPTTVSAFTIKTHITRAAVFANKLRFIVFFFSVVDSYPY